MLLHVVKFRCSSYTSQSSRRAKVCYNIHKTLRIVTKNHVNDFPFSTVTGAFTIIYCISKFGSNFMGRIPKERYFYTERTDHPWSSIQTCSLLLSEHLSTFWCCSFWGSRKSPEVMRMIRKTHLKWSWETEQLPHNDTVTTFVPVGSS